MYIYIYMIYLLIYFSYIYIHTYTYTHNVDKIPEFDVFETQYYLDYSLISKFWIVKSPSFVCLFFFAAEHAQRYVSPLRILVLSIMSGLESDRLGGGRVQGDLFKGDLMFGRWR